MKQSKPSIKHHYIPQFLLSNFTETDDAGSRLWVTDLIKCSQWKAAPSAVAYQNKLYAIEENDDGQQQDIDALEIVFSQVESLAAGVIRRIIKTESLPAGDDFNIFINFVALMFARTPTMINQLTKPITEISKMILDMALSTKERWRLSAEKMVADGILPLETLSDEYYEHMREFIGSDRYSMDINQNYKLKQLLDTIDILIPLLAHRKWSLLLSKDFITTNPDLGGFICSDNPVSLVSMNPLPSIFSPGFGMRGTEVTIPLSKNAAIIGRFEGKGGEFEVGVKAMAAINSRTCMHADRFFYHSNKNFISTNHQQQICTAKSVLEYYANNGSSESIR